MYLHDYQRTTLRKLRRGGNFILHGPRRIGLSTVTLSHALTCIADVAGTEVKFMAPNAKILEFHRKYTYDLIYAAKTTAVSAFNSDITPSSNHGDPNIVTFTNGSSIRFINGERHGATDDVSSMLMGDVFIVDCADRVKHLDILAQRASGAQMILSHSGGMYKESALHRIHVASVKGKLDYTYIRFPVEVASDKQMEHYNEMRQQLNPTEWIHEVEMVPYVR